MAPLVALIVCAAACRRSTALMRASSLAWIERLGEVVVCPHFEAENAIDVLAARGEHDDRHLRFRPHLPAQAQAILARQHHVENQEIDAMIGHCARHLPSVGCSTDVAAIAAQIFCDKRSRLAIVFDDKNIR